MTALIALAALAVAAEFIVTTRGNPVLQGGEERESARRSLDFGHTVSY